VLHVISLCARDSNGNQVGVLLGLNFQKAFPNAVRAMLCVPV
jgi:hypothetical protein